MHKFPGGTADTQTMSPVGTPVLLPDTIASQHPETAQIHNINEGEDEKEEMLANTYDENTNVGLDVNDNDIPQNDADDILVNANQAMNHRTHSVTRSVNAVKYRSDMFQNITLLQQTNRHHTPSIHNPNPCS
jgi:hypothetical protein